MNPSRFLINEIVHNMTTKLLLIDSIELPTPSIDIVKKIMKNSFKKQRKTSISLPLEGGGRRVGVKD